MEPDPIAENQTDVTIATLMSRDDGDPLMNKAVASLLAYTKKLGSEMAEIKASLWSPDALDKRISDLHEHECHECEVRKWMIEHKRAEKEKEKEKEKDQETRKPSLWSFVFSERGLLTIVVIILTLAFVRQSLGREGYRDVTHTMRSAHQEVPK